MTAVEIKRQVKTQEWASKVRACRSSGLSVRAWCQENGVSSTTYYKWESILLAAIQREDEMPGLAAKTEFAELPPLEGPGKMQRLIASLRIGGASLELYAGVDAKMAKALIEGLGHAK